MPARPRPALFRRRSTPRLVAALGASTAALTAAALAASLGVPDLGAAPSPRGADRLQLAAASTNQVTPRAFTGYGFDQCLTPSQKAMDAWLEHSPFLAVGVYTSGNSRACRSQPNLTPAWVRTQLFKGWRILPITLGPQSTCVGRFPRYGASIDPTISNSSTNRYAAARAQGTTEASRAVKAAQALGIVARSTLWYDIEGWSDYRNATCRESALAFLSGWTLQVRKLGYVSGAYSSAGSGMRILDDARATRRADVALPDAIWLARYDNVANTSASQYFSDAGWQGARIKQYTGGHNETWGGVTINIDRNWLNLGDSRPAAERHCGGVTVDLTRYAAIRSTAGATMPAPVKALQCLLREAGSYPSGPINGNFGPRTRAAAQAWQRGRGFTPSPNWSTRDWVALLSAGNRPVQKIGSRGAYVRRAQRAMQAAMPSTRVRIDGVFDATFATTVRNYRAQAGIAPAGILNTETWTYLQRGVR